MQDSPRRDRALPVAVSADIFPASAQPVAACSAALRADKAIWPALLKQIGLAGLLRLEPLPELFEVHPFLLAHLPRHPSLVRLYYYSCCPIIRHDILGLVDLSR